MPYWTYFAAAIEGWSKTGAGLACWSDLAIENRLRGTLKLCDTFDRWKFVEPIEGISFVGLPDAELELEPESSEIFWAPFLLERSTVDNAWCEGGGGAEII